MYLLASRDSWWLRQCEAALSSAAIDFTWEAAEGVPGVLYVDVPEWQIRLASEIVSEQLAEELQRKRDAARTDTRPPVPTAALSTGLLLAALTCLWFGDCSDMASHTLCYAAGAGDRQALLSGQWWRLITAATLHADLAHVAGNAAFFVALTWAAGERLGSGMAMMVWLCTAVAGFEASLWGSAADVTVGASGGLFGLLGAASAHALRTAHRHGAHWQRHREIMAAAASLLAMTAFSEHANLYAHLGGFACGMAFGAVAPARPFNLLVQAMAAIVCAGIIVTAWWAALRGVPLADLQNYWNTMIYA